VGEWLPLAATIVVEWLPLAATIVVEWLASSTSSMSILDVP
jgi:hypothetical protein